MIRRIKYYISSIPVILGKIDNWYLLLKIVFGKKPIVIKLYNGCRFKIRSLMDAWIVKETCLDREYERNSIPVKDGWTIVDIGAGIGEFSILAAKENPNSRVFAFEPFPESFEIFQENIVLNDLKNVNEFQIAVGATTSEMTLSTTGEAVQYTTTESLISGKATSRIKVQGLSLDNIFLDNCLDHCNFLKIDCEGCEFEILLNASLDTFEKIDHICLEYHEGFSSHTLPDLINFLEQNGFLITISQNPVHPYLGYLYAFKLSS